MNSKFKELKVYQMSFKAAMEIFCLTQKFPKEEKYSLTDQIRRSSRSVCANIVEGYHKRIYKKSFISKLVDADGECNETLLWLEFAIACNYITPDQSLTYISQYQAIGRMLGFMLKNPEKFL
ncbi:MAG: four helix bundle protein [Bacteroidales bacterium]